MIVRKITAGCVVQTYGTKTGSCVEQEFIAGDDVEYVNQNGDPVDWREDAYQTFDMVQPEQIPAPEDPNNP